MIIVPDAKMLFEIIEVKTYCGYKFNEEPRTFRLHGEQHQVREIIDRWYSAGIHPLQPQYDYYKVLDKNGREYLLRYNRKRDVWSVLIR